MRVSLSLWTALAVSALPASAFYPYQPNYGSDESAAKVRRSVSPSASRVKSVTWPLRRASVRRDNIYRIIKSKEPSQENSVAIDQDANADGVGYDRSYMVGITIGDSKEEYHLLLDSAASNTWLMGAACDTKACGTHALFGNEDSSSLKVSSERFEVEYGTGKVLGVLATDTVNIGPGLSPTLSFGLATDVSDEFYSFPMDGILGIGRGTDVEGDVDSPQVMDVLKSSSLINSRLYGVHLHRAEDGLNDGELNFGAPNTDRYDGDLNNVPLVDNKDGFWEIKVEGLGIDDDEVDTDARTAIIDTGTAFIFMPKPDAVALHDLIPGSKEATVEAFTIPCDTDKKLWIRFGGQKYSISTADWVGDNLGGNTCGSNIIGRQTFGDSQWLVGDVFLKNVYTVFDIDGAQVGFGVKDGSEGKPSSLLSPSATPDSSPSQSGSAVPTPTEPLVVPGTKMEVSGTSVPTETATGTGSAASPTGGASPIAFSHISVIMSLALGLFLCYL